MHGFLSRDGTPPEQLLTEASEQLLRYPSVKICRKSVSQIESIGGRFRAVCGDDLATARRVILATGMIDDLPSIPGLRERWGHSIFSCPYCDGWEVRDGAIAIAGDAEDLVPLAQELYQWSRRLTICGLDASNCGLQERIWIREAGVAINASSIIEVGGSAGLTVFLESGEVLPFDALFLCRPLRQHSNLASAIGCALTPGGRLWVDADQMTSVPGVYAAGDACSHIHQVVTAAASGAVAAISVNTDLGAEDVRNVIAAADRLEAAAIRGRHD